MKADIQTKGKRQNVALPRSANPTPKHAAPPPGAGAGDVLKLTHIVKNKKTDGVTWYVYAWRGGPRIAKVEGEPKPVLGEQERQAILNAIADAASPRREGRTVSWLIGEWTGWGRAGGPSPEWAALADTTKKSWGAALGLIDRKWGKVPLKVIGDDRMVEMIYKWRDSRAQTPRAADMGVQVLRSLLSFGLRLGVPRNTAAGIPSLYLNGSRAEIIWLPDDIKRFEEGAKAMGMPSVALAVRLAALTGLRRADLITLTEGQVNQVRILKRARKKSRRKRVWVSIPRLPPLDALLRELRDLPRCNGVETLLVDEGGKQWAPDRLTRNIQKICERQGIKHVDEDTGEIRRKHLHDCRGTFATNLMVEGGLSDAEIADILGWSTENVAQIRKLYVGGEAYAVAIGERMRAAKSRTFGDQGPGDA